MKKLLTILSFILLLLICLVVMFCSNAKDITGGDGKNGDDNEPPKIIKSEVYYSKLMGTGTYNDNSSRLLWDIWTLYVNSDRTIRLTFNGTEMQLESNKYDDVWNASTEEFYIRLKGTKSSGITIDLKHNTFTAFWSYGYGFNGYTAGGGELKKGEYIMTIDKDYEYYFIYDHNFIWFKQRSSYESEYTNATLKLNSNGSIYFNSDNDKFSHLSINIDDINDIKKYHNIFISYTNKILIISNYTYEIGATNIIVDFDKKTIFAEHYSHNLKDMDARITGSIFPTNYKFPQYGRYTNTGWVQFTNYYSRNTHCILLYYDCNPTNQSYWLYKYKVPYMKLIAKISNQDIKNYINKSYFKTEYIDEDGNNILTFDFNNPKIITNKNSKEGTILLYKRNQPISRELELDHTWGGLNYRFIEGDEGVKHHYDYNLFR